MLKSSMMTNTTVKSTLYLFYNTNGRFESAYRQYGSDETKEYLTEEDLEILRQALETKHEG